MLLPFSTDCVDLVLQPDVLLIGKGVVRLRVLEGAAVVSVSQVRLLERGQRKDGGNLLEVVVVLDLQLAQLVEAHSGQLGNARAGQVEFDQIFQVGKSVLVNVSELAVAAKRAGSF